MSESCELADRVCEPCRGDIPPMENETAETMLMNWVEVGPSTHPVTWNACIPSITLYGR